VNAFSTKTILGPFPALPTLAALLPPSLLAKDRERRVPFLYLLVVLVLVVLVVALQLEGAPDSGALDLVGVPQRVRHGVDRGLYGSVDEHGRGGLFFIEKKRGIVRKNEYVRV